MNFAILVEENKTQSTYSKRICYDYFKKHFSSSYKSLYWRDGKYFYHIFGIMNIFMLPSPVWFTIVDLGFANIPRHI